MVGNAGTLTGLLRGLLATLAMLAALLAVLPVQAAALAGDWRKAVPGEDPEGVRHADSGFAPFDTTRLTSFPRNPDGVWVRLRPVSGAWPEAGEVLVVRGPDFERVTFFPSSDRPYSRSLHDLDPTAEPAGHGRLHFALDPPPADGEALLLRFEPQPVLAAGVTFAIVPRADYLREEARWLAVASACFAIMLAMALVAAFSSLVLRDVSFLYYAGYVLSYAAIQALQCGYAFHPLGFASIAAAPWNWGRILTGLSVLLATLFLDRFASTALRRRGTKRPRLARPCSRSAGPPSSWLRPVICRANGRCASPGR